MLPVRNQDDLMETRNPCFEIWLDTPVNISPPAIGSLQCVDYILFWLFQAISRYFIMASQPTPKHEIRV